MRATYPYVASMAFDLTTGSKAALWTVAFGLLLAGSRWARAAVALAVVAQLAFGYQEAAWLYPASSWPQLGNLTTAMLALHTSGLASCLAMAPLVLWRLDEPRAALALLALGRRREAWLRSGGALSLLAAVPVVALNHVTLELLEKAIAPFCLAALALVLVRYGEVMVAWPLRGKQVG